MNLIPEIIEARQLAQGGNFLELLKLCKKIKDRHQNELSPILEIGTLLLDAGLLSTSEFFFQYALTLQPNHPSCVFNLAKIYFERGEFSASRELYRQLIFSENDNELVRRSYLTSLEYDPSTTDEERRFEAENWGKWIINKQGGLKSRPMVKKIDNRRLRIGYISPDFCNHVVGLFVKNIFSQHDPKRVQIFTYQAQPLKDWVTDEIGKYSVLKEVYSLNDYALANLIQLDEIDILVDLSGHTAGSRLGVFALRPAPIQISWLGYFSTTGLKYMDAVFLDEAHTTPETQNYFTEKIISLPQTRFCYKPVHFSPPARPSPFVQKGFITFGSFNNTAKYNKIVFELWSRILNKVPNSRLILKWRTFNDLEYSNEVRNYFVERDVDVGRIELRGPSFHLELLNQYGDIDIALDPFPFSGCMTSLEALWMGVPVITLPGTRVVSRQTHSILKSIGLSEFSAHCEDEYIKIAVELADNPEKLIKLRKDLPYLMLGSPLMDVKNFTLQLEEAFFNVYRSIENGSF